MFLAPSDKINLIIGILTIVIGILSVILGWVMWRLTREHAPRRRLGHESEFNAFLPLSTSESP